MNTEFVALVGRYLKYTDGRAISSDAPLRDLGLDSMAAVELLFAVEDTYDIVIGDEHLTDATFETAGALWSVIQQLRSQAEPARPQ